MLEKSCESKSQVVDMELMVKELDWAQHYQDGFDPLSPVLPDKFYEIGPKHTRLYAKESKLKPKFDDFDMFRMMVTGEDNACVADLREYKDFEAHAIKQRFIPFPCKRIGDWAYFVLMSADTVAFYRNPPQSKQLCSPMDFFEKPIEWLGNTGSYDPIHWGKNVRVKP